MIYTEKSKEIDKSSKICHDFKTKKDGDDHCGDRGNNRTEIIGRPQPGD
jgi:hypothetical protein